MSKTRFAVLAGWNKVILGRNLADALQAGHLYEVENIAGCLVINDLGEHAQLPEHHVHLNDVASTGQHCHTQAEWDAIERKPVTFRD